MKIKQEFVIREVGGDTILVPIGKSVYTSNGLYALNELGAFILGLLPDVENEEEICKAVLEEYDVTPEEASRDITEFLNKLKDMDVI